MPIGRSVLRRSASYILFGRLCPANRFVKLLIKLYNLLHFIYFLPLDFLSDFYFIFSISEALRPEFFQYYSTDINVCFYKTIFATYQERHSFSTDKIDFSFIKHYISQNLLNYLKEILF